MPVADDGDLKVAAKEESSSPTAAAGVDDSKNSDSDGDDAEEILEESPDKRWSKRKEKVKQRDVPGIDLAQLAMDNETGIEVVWNEVQFSERKNFREQEEKLKSVFDNLTQLVHINLVKFHKYWTDSKSDKPRIIFITEYMSSGSMSRFLLRARSSGTPLNLKVWKKWTTQILSALNYLHSCEPPIVHANLTCNTVFIQQNGLLKIGCVAPNAIHHHVKTFRENLKNMHYVAPEYEHLVEVTTQVDIYSFGICALEMATTGGLSSNSSGTESVSPITPDVIRKAIDSIEDAKQRNFIEICLDPDPKKRPTARQLLFHEVLFEVHSLKLLAAHVIVASKLVDHLSEDDLRVPDPTRIAASTSFKDVPYNEAKTFQFDIDKFLEDVRNGIYPLIAFAPLAHTPTKLQTSMSSAAITQPPADVAVSHHPLNATGTGTTSAAAAPIAATATTDTTNLNNRTTGQKERSPSHGATRDGSTTRQTSAFFSIGDTALPTLESTAAATKLETTLAQTLVHHRDEGYDTVRSVHPAAAIAPQRPAGGASSAAASATISPTQSSAATVATSASPPPAATATTSNEAGASTEKTSKETRSIVRMQATVEGSHLQTVLQMQDLMNRQLVTELRIEDTPEELVASLIEYDFISERDADKLIELLHPVLERFKVQQEAASESGKSTRKSSRQLDAPIANNEAALAENGVIQRNDDSTEMKPT